MGTKEDLLIAARDLDHGLQAILSFGDMWPGRPVLTKAYLEARGPRPLPERARRLLRGFIALGCVGRDGRRLVDVALDEMEGLTAAGRELLVCLREARGRLWRVERGGARASLHAVLPPAEQLARVHDLERPARLRTGDLVFAWVARVGRRDWLTRSCMVVPTHHQPAVVAELEALLAAGDAAQESSDQRHREGAEVGRLIAALWRRPPAEAAAPRARRAARMSGLTQVRGRLEAEVERW